MKTTNTPGYYWCRIGGHEEPAEWTGKEWWGIAMLRPYEANEIEEVIRALATPAPAVGAAATEAPSRLVRAIEYSNDFAGVKMLRYPTEPAPAGEWVKTELSSAAPALGASPEPNHALKEAIDALEIVNRRPRPMCRDCADEDGTCPGSGLPCDMLATIRNARTALAAVGASPEPLSLEFIEKHIGIDEGDRDAVLALVREVEAAHNIRMRKGVTECLDNDSPWLICKTCAAKGECDKAAAEGASVQPVPASLSDEQIDGALQELNDLAVKYSIYDYGLPMHDDGEVHRMRSVIRALATTSTAASEVKP